MAKHSNSAKERSKGHPSSIAIKNPPRSVFQKLLVDPERAADLTRILRKYPDPAQQHYLLRVLRDARFSHQLRSTRGDRVSHARAWFKKRDRWRAGVSRLDKEMETILSEFRDSIYPVLRASNSLPDGYSRDLADVFSAIDRLQDTVNSNPILSQSFSTRGHQKEPYLAGAVTAMRALHITKADAQDLLVLIGVKHDPFAL